jgi:hypothetical protein
MIKVVRQIGLFLCVFICALTAFAQENTPIHTHKLFNCGLMFGINASMFTDPMGEFGAGNPSEYKKYAKFSAVIGFHTRLQFTRVFALRPEFIFNGRGGSYRSDNTGVVTIGSTGDEKNYFYKNYRLNYAEIPLLMELDFAANSAPDKVHFRMAAGMSYGFLVSSSLRYNGFPPTGKTTGPLTNVKEEYQVTEFKHGRKSIPNAIVELSFDFINKSDQPMFIRIRYEGALMPVYEPDPKYNYNLRTYMNTFGITYGIYFNK